MNDTERKTLAAFIAENNIIARPVRLWERIDADERDDWGKGARHFQVKLERLSGPGRISEVLSSMVVQFSQGSAHTKQPTAADVLDALASDSSSIESARDFSDWCADMGWNDDSRKALRCWEECRRQAYKLEVFLGRTAYRDLLDNVERL